MSTQSARTTPWPGRLALLAIVFIPLGVMGFIAVAVLLPTLKDPQSNLYASSLGYPSLKRLVGQPIKVKTAAVSEKPVESAVAAPGESVALQVVDVRSLVTGTVEEVYVVEGQRVQAGDPLFRLESATFENQVKRSEIDLQVAREHLQNLPKVQREKLIELEANVEIAKNQLAVSEAQLNAQKQLEIPGAVSPIAVLDAEEDYLSRKNELITAEQELSQALISDGEALEAARLDVVSSEIDLQDAVRSLEQTEVYANTDGLISAVNIHPGDVSSTEDSVITLTQDVVFKAFIDQARLDATKIGDLAAVRLVAYPGQVFEGKVIRLNPTVATRANDSDEAGINRQYTYSVWIEVNGLDMPPGLQGYAQFDPQKISLVIPESSFVHLSAGEGMVLVAEGGQAIVRQVRVGEIYDTQREVLEGLTLGEQVVRYPRALQPGDQLKVSQTEGIATDNTPDDIDGVETMSAYHLN